MLPADADDDLNTLLWEQQFEFIEYHFNEFLTDAAPIEYTGEKAGERTRGRAGPGAGGSPRRHQAGRGRARTGIVDIEDFDSTLYFLDEAEIAYMVKALEREYNQDFRKSTLYILLDLLELQTDENTGPNYSGSSRS